MKTGENIPLKDRRPYKFLTITNVNRKHMILIELIRQLNDCIKTEKTRKKIEHDERVINNDRLRCVCSVSVQ